ncbi:hypothetical protein SPIROBIBN47_100147 [uncultured spirochete]|uniref:Uncharacterized protein n=1 Tax=uncultured spirochete TaxID=156406 RepID=A0A3P3XF99_9SPIR|nr:hypothetical protein SPIROBIBN47_100147 [uncultured spirochete]
MGSAFQNTSQMRAILKGYRKIRGKGNPGWAIRNASSSGIIGRSMLTARE